MGAGASNGPMEALTTRRFFDPTNSFKSGRQHLSDDGEKPGGDALAAYSIIGGQPERIAAAKAALQQVREAASAGGSDPATKALDRSLGCVLGNTVGDALGAPLEFSPVRYDVLELKGLCHDEIWNRSGYNSFSLQPGQWTDDDSMGLCIMDSLLVCNGFDPLDLRQRFHGWITHGYNNAFGRDPDRKSRDSVGLGGNISMSIDEWEKGGSPQTQQGNIYTSGNGSVMRNGAIPVWFRGDVNAGMDAAYWQSRTTHRGEEAAECCRLLTFLCTAFLNGAGRELLDSVDGFDSPSYAVTCLVRGECEEAHEQNANPIFGGLERRQWNWKAQNFHYCEYRAQENPGYIGSYAMDNVSMALHCVYSTQNFVDATLKAANMCGDSDSVCAVVGQLAGALYGASAIPADWLERVQRWDGGSIAARALMLHNHEPIERAETLSDAACATAKLLGTPHATAEPSTDCGQKRHRTDDSA